MCVTESPTARDGCCADELEIEVRADGGHVVVRVTGELDHGSHDALVAAMSQLPASAALLVVDLSDCPFVGAAPFRHLARVATGLRRRGTTLVVRQPPASFRILNATLRGPFRSEVDDHRR